MQKLMSFLGNLFLDFVLLMAELDVARCEILAEEVMNSEFQSVQFVAKRDGKVYNDKVEESENEMCSLNAKMHFRGKNNMAAAFKNLNTPPCESECEKVKRNVRSLNAKMHF